MQLLSAYRLSCTTFNFRNWYPKEICSIALKTVLLIFESILFQSGCVIYSSFTFKKKREQATRKADGGMDVGTG